MEESNRKEALRRNSREEEKEDRDYKNLEERYLTKRRNLENSIERARVSEKTREKLIGDIEEERRKITRIEEDLRTTIDTEIREVERDIRLAKIEEGEVESKVFEEFKKQIEFEDKEIERLTIEEENFEVTVRRGLLEDINTNSERLPKRIKDLLAARRMGSDFKALSSKEKRYKGAYKFFKKRTWS